MEELEQELNSTIKHLNSEISENREESRKIKDSHEFQLEFREFLKYKYQFDPQEFVAKSFLHLMHHLNDTGDRPQTIQSFDSSCIQLYNNDILVDKVKPETTYTCKCVVFNRGDLASPLTNVEYFVNKEEDENLLSMKVFGVRTFPLHTEVRVKITKGSVKVGDCVKIRSGNQFIYTKVKRVGRVFGSKRPYRILPDGTKRIIKPNKSAFSIDLHLFGASAQLVKIKDIITNDAAQKFNLQEAFRFEVEDVFTISGRGTVAAGKLVSGYYSIGNLLTLERTGSTISVVDIESFRRLGITQLSKGMGAGLLIRGDITEKIVRGDVLLHNSTSDLNAIVENVIVPTTIKNYDFLGTQTLTVPALVAEISEFSITTPKSDNRHHFVVAARAFASMPIDMPENFDQLSPAYERHSAIKVFLWE